MADQRRAADISVTELKSIVQWSAFLGVILGAIVMSLAFGILGMCVAAMRS